MLCQVQPYPAICQWRIFGKCNDNEKRQCTTFSIKINLKERELCTQTLEIHQKKYRRDDIYDMEDGKAETASLGSSTGRDGGFWEHLSHFSVLPLWQGWFTLIHQKKLMSTMKMQLFTNSSFNDLWEAFDIIKEAREIFQTVIPPGKPASKISTVQGLTLNSVQPNGTSYRTQECVPVLQFFSCSSLVTTS